ncbi:MAG TPA: hypothetical protein VEL03_20645 [Streptosporangiaceae bacterium]|nr:hypothetical protein [Streptosporangiaceae bacterium]
MRPAPWALSGGLLGWHARPGELASLAAAGVSLRVPQGGTGPAEVSY